MSIYGTEIYTTLETNYLKSDIYFTSLDTIGIKAELINVSTNMIISMGYISGLTNVSNLSSAVNKYYVDNSSQFVPYGTVGAIQFKSNEGTLISSDNLNYTSNTSILRSTNVETGNSFTEDLFLGSNEIKSNNFSSDYSLILPITTGVSGQILGLNNNASKLSNELFSFLNGGSIWSPINKQFLTVLNLPVFGTSPPPSPDYTITIGYSNNGLQWTTYVYVEEGLMVSPLWINNAYYVSYGNSTGTLFKLLKSEDGLTWSSIFETDKGVPTICYSEYLDTYVGITSNFTGNTTSLISSDLINWTTYSQNFQIDTFSPQILWIDELLLFITYDNETFSYFLSKNGINWDIYNNVLNFRITSCTWAPELGIISLTGKEYCAVSGDGINWTTSKYKFGTDNDYELTRTIWCPPIEGIRPGYFVSSITGEVPNSDLTPAISTDGLDWRIYSRDYGGNFAGIAYQPDKDIVSFIPSYVSNAYIIDFGNYLTFFNNGFVPSGSNTELQFNINGNFNSNSNLTFDKNTNTISVTSPNSINISSSIITNVNINNLFIENTVLKSSNSFVNYTINLPNTPPDNNNILITDGINSFSFTTSSNSVPKGPSDSIQINYLGDLDSSLITFNPDTELYIPGPLLQFNNSIPFTSINSITTTIDSFFLFQNMIYTVGNNQLSFIPTDNFQIINQLTFTSCSNIFINGYYSFITNTESLIISNISGNGLYYNTLISSISVSTSGTSIPIYVYNNYCYLGLANSLLTIDVSNIINPTTISNTNINGINNLTVYDDFLYISNSTNFMKLSINNNPTTLQTLAISGITSFTINNNYCYLSNSTDLITIDLIKFSTKTTMSLSNINCLYSTYKTLFIGTNTNIKVYDISNPLNINLINTITDTNINGITLLGNKLYYFNNINLIEIDTKGSELTSLSAGNIYTNQITVMNNVYNEGTTMSNSINVSNTLNVENIKLYKEIIELVDYSDITVNNYNAIVIISDSSSITVGNFIDIVVTNDKVTLNSQINVGILTYQFGLPFINVINKINGMFTIRINNLRDTLFGIVKFYFIVY